MTGSSFSAMEVRVVGSPDTSGMIVVRLRGLGITNIDGGKEDAEEDDSWAEQRRLPT